MQSPTGRFDGRSGNTDISRGNTDPTPDLKYASNWLERLTRDRTVDIQIRLFICVTRTRKKETGARIVWLQTKYKQTLEYVPIYIVMIGVDVTMDKK